MSDAHGFAGASRAPFARAARPPVSLFEFWPSWLFYTPVAAYCVWLGLRHHSLMLPTAANPRIAFGGLVGERKSSILDQVSAPARAWIAPYAVIETGPEPGPADLVRALAAMAARRLSFPLVAKPDLGCNGTGVRILREKAELAAYLAEFPRRLPLLLQRYIADPGEAGLFYVRRPGERSGRITSVTLKFVPEIVGDGMHCLRELILADPRGRRARHLYLPQLGGSAERVPVAGEVVKLVLVGNHCKGSIFRNGAHLITPALSERVEALARALPDFHFGRFDVRYCSLAELRRGEKFTVIEINGAGSEATHIWDAETPLLDAYISQFTHYRLAFEIGAGNRARGTAPASIAEIWRQWRRHKRLMASYPAHD